MANSKEKKKKANKKEEQEGEFRRKEKESEFKAAPMLPLPGDLFLIPPYLSSSYKIPTNQLFLIKTHKNSSSYLPTSLPHTRYQPPNSSS